MKDHLFSKEDGWDTWPHASPRWWPKYLGQCSLKWEWVCPCLAANATGWELSSRGYNVPELLTELVIVAAVNTCIYAQMLSRQLGTAGGLGILVVQTYKAAELLDAS